ncbi:MAG: MFS transporter [Alphaproteobacteria bacterium]
MVEPSRAAHVGSARLAAVPKGVWALGFVSMFMDISSEMVHSLLPVFLVSVLGASVLTVGLIEGLAEATVAVTKLFSGTLSDYLGKRKLLAVVGYGVAALSKPVMPLAPSVAWVFGARVLDRMGKGIRGAPRDALVGDISPPHVRGAAYGLRQSLDTVGAFIGPLLAIAFMALLAGDIRSVFWIAVIPAFISVGILVVAVKEPQQRGEAAARPQLRAADFRRLGRAYWSLLLVAVVFTFSRFSEAFLVLRAAHVGLSAGLVPLVLVVMSVAYAVSAYPAGRLSDRMDRYHLLAVGFATMVAANVVLALAPGIASVLAGVALWGLHMGLTQGLFAALVADTSPPRLRGTAFGVFNLATGIVVLAASLLAGWLWDLYGPTAAFATGAGFASVALALMLVVRRRTAADVA